ncbi:MAG: 50S ribosomal protein L6 [Ruminococcaceae bacterium]|nr:50S ribosomal protein L6 [Oscillospiraceae bacterium]
MSRIGRMPITIPAGVTVEIAEGNVVTVKGKLGTLTQTFSTRMQLVVEGNELKVLRPTDEKEDRSVHGLTRALLNDMVIGVSEGYQKVLAILGVGYKAVKQGKNLLLYLGHSLMPVTGMPQDKFIIPETDAIKLEVPSDDEIKKQGIDKMCSEKVTAGMVVIVKGIDKQAVGQMAAVIRGKRPPEPYHGKGVRYIDESVRRKAGKTGK